MIIIIIIIISSSRKALRVANDKTPCVRGLKYNAMRFDIVQG